MSPGDVTAKENKMKHSFKKIRFPPGRASLGYFQSYILRKAIKYKRSAYTGKQLAISGTKY